MGKKLEIGCRALIVAHSLIKGCREKTFAAQTAALGQEVTLISGPVFKYGVGAWDVKGPGADAFRRRWGIGPGLLLAVPSACLQRIDDPEEAETTREEETIEV